MVSDPVLTTSVPGTVPRSLIKMPLPCRRAIPIREEMRALAARVHPGVASVKYENYVTFYFNSSLHRLRGHRAQIMPSINVSSQNVYKNRDISATCTVEPSIITERKLLRDLD